MEFYCCLNVDLVFKQFVIWKSCVCSTNSGDFLCDFHVCNNDVATVVVDISNKIPVRSSNHSTTGRHWTTNSSWMTDADDVIKFRFAPFPENNRTNTKLLNLHNNLVIKILRITVAIFYNTKYIFIIYLL